MKKEELTLNDYLDLYHILNDYEEQNNKNINKDRLQELKGRIMRLRIKKLEKLEGYYKLPNGQFINVEIKGGALYDKNNIEISEEELKNYKKIG